MRLYLLLLVCLPLLSRAQSTNGLIAAYRFESNLGDATGDAANLGVAEGVVDYDCGVSGSGLLLQNPGDYVRVPGGASTNVNRLYDESDFTVSLNFKPIAGSGEQFLISKRDTACAFDGAYFSISYAPGLQQLTAVLQEGNVRVELSHVIRNTSCWQTVTLARERTRATLYLNGREVATENTAALVNVSNTGDLLLGATACGDVAGSTFRGLLDDVYLYDRALATEEVRALYPNSDRILTPDSQLFLGESLPVSVKSNCGTEFSWSPAADVASPDVAEPTITPTRAGRQTYVLSIGDELSSCVAIDSLTIRVIDPDSLDCRDVFLPKAFTPNGIGPEVNETFGISNPYAVGTLIAFDIFDRNGGKVFSTTDPFARWDGTFRGKPVNPGVVLWRLVYNCEREETVRTGSVTILR